MKTIDIATFFVDLTLKHDWNEVKELPDDEVRVLFETVSAAGFEPQKIVPGKLIGYYLDSDGSRTGGTYPINSFCPYKVVSREGEDHYRATGWLDCALRYAQKGGTEYGEQFIYEVIRQEIERSVPLEPIRLTSNNDLLREYPPPRALGYFVDHTRDDRKLGHHVGVHDCCKGWVDRTRVTETHDVLVCRSCHLRVLFPKDVKTYGELRQAMASKLAQVPT